MPATGLQKLVPNLFGRPDDQFMLILTSAVFIRSRFDSLKHRNQITPAHTAGLFPLSRHKANYDITRNC